MSNLRDSVSERNVDGSRAAPAQVSTSQPFQSKSSHINKMKDKRLHIPPKNSPKKQRPQDRAVDELSTQCQNISINKRSTDTDQEPSSSQQKGKNAKKKERLKQLNMPQTSTSWNIPQQPQIYEPGCVEELFKTKISPLYDNTSSRYLENLIHHPQYQYMQHAKNSMCVPSSAHDVNPPNTPLFPTPQRPISKSFPNTPVTNPQMNSSKFFQNMMQHPLLSQTLSDKAVAGHSSPKRNRNKKKETKNDEEKKFDPYLTADEVEEGLKNNILVEGVLRINPKQFQHAYVSGTSDRSEQDILLDGIKSRNRALEGDIVIVQLLENVPETEEESDNKDKQKKGKVVYIKEKVHNRTCIGSLKLMPDKNRQKALFVPRDHRMPRLNIPCTYWPDNFYNNSKSYENILFLAQILHWADTRFALGKIERNIGQSGDMMTETKAILAESGLDVTPFGPEVRHLYPRLDYVIPDEEIKLREDCRKMCIFSIDPASCRDIDDAVSCRELENGNYEIGVHISDVSHFLTEGTPLDEKVAEKATTVYLVEKAYHMLPDDLCMLCSLFPGVDKLAFSVFWEITKDAIVLSHRFAKTVIHSCAQLAYDHAQAVLDGNDEAEAGLPEIYNGHQAKDVQKVIKILGSIAAILRKERFDSGALRIDQPKISFSLNANGLPDSVHVYDNRESHKLIEEFMLLANMTVAKRIHDDHPKLAFLRCHPPPSRYMLKQLAKALKPMDIHLDVSNAGSLHHSLLPYVGPESADTGKAMVLNMLCAKPMARAKYFCADGCHDDDFLHYALNVPLYTHFTSPIRRYADIMVHRLLSASLKYRDMPQWEVDKVRMVAAQCNKQKYNAKKAGELSVELYTLKYIEMHSPLVTDAVVVEVREKYIDVVVIAMGLNRRIFFNNDFPGEYRRIKHEDGEKLSVMELTWREENNKPPTIQLIHVFSILKIQLHKGDDMVKVETKLVKPQPTIQ